MKQFLLTFLLAVALFSQPAFAYQPESPVAVAGKGGDELTVADAQTKPTIVVVANADKWEKQAADDLAKYIKLMTGAEATVGADAAGQGPFIYVGQAALAAKGDLQGKLDKVAKKNPTRAADAIVAVRDGNKLYLAGTNDESHYFAASYLLHQWGCRWYVPTEFGESIPELTAVKVGKLDHAYGTPFEIREYWNAWNGSYEGKDDFSRRNFMNSNRGFPNGHAIGEYTKEVIPPGKTMMNIPIAEDKTAETIAKHIGPRYEKGENISIGMEDGLYLSDSPVDKELQAGLWDKYFINPMMTDNFMVLYNKIGRILAKQYPQSNAKLGFLAYSNITIPPQREVYAEKNLVAYLAPIDIDPNHGMDDPRSPPRQEYKRIMYRWAEVMQGRVAIYDYDQGMLVWRDIPNPSHMAFRHDVKHYAKAGILGVATESRGATGTVFLNLYHRGQLMWNPEYDLDAELAVFYPRFYGPAAEPMSKYWGRLYKAWEDTIVTEHEHFVAPAIYTKEVVEELGKHLAAAEKAMKDAEGKEASKSRDWAKYQQRMQFTRHSYDTLNGYMTMVFKANTEADYAAAAAAGAKGAEARLAMANMNPTFTTRVIEPVAETEATGPAWFLGEIKQYRDLAELTGGAKGTLITKLPLEWSFRTDPHDTGLARGWGYDPENEKDWKKLRTDLYMQAQGVLHDDQQSYTGYSWYRTSVDLNADQTQGNVHIMFPGLFNTCWLYVNGVMVAHREQGGMWWLNDYKFEWDVDLSGKLKPGKNDIVLRVNTVHHWGGMFRRPILYKAK